MKERDYTLDLIRLISIFLVVVIHISNYYNRYLDDMNSSSYFIATLYNSFARISVPLFFMISGSLVLNEDLKERKLIRKISHFIFVLIVWTVIYLIFDLAFMQKTFTVSEIMNLIFEPLKPHLWFMYAIIALYIVTPFTQLLVQNMDEHLENVFILLWSSFTGGVQLLRIVFEHFNLNADITYSIPFVQGTYYLGYYMVGYILYNRIKSGKKISSTPYMILYMLSMMFIFLGTYLMSNYEEVYFGDLLTYRNLFVILASTSFFLVVLKNVRITIPKLQSILTKISPNLFGVYLFHIIPFDLLIRTVNIKNVHALVGVPFFSLIIFVSSLVVVHIVRRIPFLRNIF